MMREDVDTFATFGGFILLEIARWIATALYFAPRAYGCESTDRRSVKSCSADRFTRE